MNIIELIRNLLQNEKYLSNEHKIIINNECFSFFEGISIINCNNLTKDKYTIKYSNDIQQKQNFINIPSYTLKDIYNKIIKLESPNTCQYVTVFIKRISYFYYFNKNYT
ncbi:hypothetical protein BCR36DRAFT_450132 [Piromyces finnis]|uniref:Uncharacterized protein n=1 Tax=Piromyces finnis TaxID=1754191 RepID=A0A1Y1V8B6_9FUNG|nr:hypothetical protein BCR36DRAFT_450132 [Piromyces finnis]|eukprot:ORX49592.1 hypothetical protein BCR36DRAFT_450132 [Piromyces finnis]